MAQLYEVPKCEKSNIPRLGNAGGTTTFLQGKWIQLYWQTQ
jgi:hypothetical protein